MTAEQLAAAKKKAQKDLLRPSIITESFQGKVRITAEKEITIRKKVKKAEAAVPEDGGEDGEDKFTPRGRDAPDRIATPKQTEPDAETKAITTTTETPF